MNDASATDRWRADRTTFQRVYDVVVGTHEFLTATEFAERVDCSESGARQALEQLAEMGIAERRDGRPTNYRRNDSYFTWRRVESLAREHSPEELRRRVDDLIEEDETFQDAYDVPAPDAVSIDDVPVDDHDAFHQHWEDLGEWRTLRRDIRVLRRAVQRADERTDDVAPA